MWQLPNKFLTSNLASAVEKNYYARVPPEKRPRQFRDEQLENEKPSSLIDPEKADHEEVSQPTTDELKSPKAKRKPRHDSSLLWALLQTFAWPWWISGGMKFCGDTLRTTTPLVTRVLLTWLTSSYVYSNLTESERTGVDAPLGIVSFKILASTGVLTIKCQGYGVGISFGLFAMQGSSDDL